MKHKKGLHVIYIISTSKLSDAHTVSLSLVNTVATRGITTHLVSSMDGTLITSNNKQTMPQHISCASPLNHIRTFIQLVKTIRALRAQYPHIIMHTQSGQASLIGRWAALLAGVKTRIHTIHHYRFHDQTVIRWMCYALERITNRITTHYICASSHDVKTGIKLFPRFHEKHSIIFEASTRIPTLDITYHALPMNEDEHVRLYRTFTKRASTLP